MRSLLNSLVFIFSISASVLALAGEKQCQPVFSTPIRAKDKRSSGHKGSASFKRPQVVGLTVLTKQGLFRQFAQQGTEYALTQKQPGLIITVENEPALLVLSASVVSTLSLHEMVDLYQNFVRAPMPEITRLSLEAFVMNPNTLERLPQTQLYSGKCRKHLERILNTSKPILFTMASRESPPKDAFIILPYNRGKSAQQEIPPPKAIVYEAPERLRFNYLKNQGLFRNFASQTTSTRHALTDRRPGAVVIRPKSSPLFALSARVISKLSVSEVESLYQDLVGAPLPSSSRQSFEEYFANKEAFERTALSEMYRPHTLDPIQRGGKALLFTVSNLTTKANDDAFFLLPYAETHSADEPEADLAPDALEYALLPERFDLIEPITQYILSKPNRLRILFGPQVLTDMLNSRDAAHLPPYFFKAIRAGIVGDRASTGIKVLRAVEPSPVEVVFKENTTTYSLYGCLRDNHAVFTLFTYTPIKTESELKELCEQ